MASPSYLCRIEALEASASTRPHGTRVRYMSGCRCMVCRAANSRYETTRYAERKAGNTNGLVPSDRARAHVEALSQSGVGYKSVAAAAGVSATIIGAIKWGRRLNIREETERRILGVDCEARGGGALVSAREAWRKLDRLIEMGYTRVQLAEWMGLKRAIQFRRDTITWENHVRVEKLWRLAHAGKLERTR